MFRKIKHKRTLKKIGEREYNFDYKLEKSIYCNLCCMYHSKKILRNLDEKLKFNSYSQWRQYVYNKYIHCSNEGLIEFSRYLNQRIRNVKPAREIWDILVSIIMTFVFIEGGNKVIEKSENLHPESSFIVFVIIYLIAFILIIFTIIVVMSQIIIPIFDNDIEENMFIDYKEIIDDMIKRKEIEKQEKDKI